VVKIPVKVESLGNLSQRYSGPEGTPGPGCPCAAPLGLPPSTQGPGPHGSTWGHQPLQRGRSPAPHSPTQPRHGSCQVWATHKPKSQPGLGLSLSPGRCPMPGAGAVPVPPAALLPPAVGQALELGPALGQPGCSGRGSSRPAGPCQQRLLSLHIPLSGVTSLAKSGWTSLTLLSNCL